MRVDAYAFASETFCRDCGREIMDKIQSGEMMGTPDSDRQQEYPQPIFTYEADHPDHCTECDELLPAYLTEHGREYVKQEVLYRELNGGSLDNWPICEWMEAYDIGSQLVQIRDFASRENFKERVFDAFEEDKRVVLGADGQTHAEYDRDKGCLRIFKPHSIDLDNACVGLAAEALAGLYCHKW